MEVTSCALQGPLLPGLFMCPILLPILHETFKGSKCKSYSKYSSAGVASRTDMVALSAVNLSLNAGITVVRVWLRMSVIFSDAVTLTAVVLPRKELKEYFFGLIDNYAAF